ncbi:hypothetical protein [Streptomyces sp. NBC_01006]|nr:hypothetical protein OG509_03300 [Streptomyces sp. NBC_01006]
MEQAKLTLEEVLDLVENRPEKTRTCRVPDGVIAALPLTDA